MMIPGPPIRGIGSATKIARLRRRPSARCGPTRRSTSISRGSKPSFESSPMEAQHSPTVAAGHQRDAQLVTESEGRHHVSVARARPALAVRGVVERAPRGWTGSRGRRTVDIVVTELVLEKLLRCCIERSFCPGRREEEGGRVDGGEERGVDGQHLPKPTQCLVAELGDGKSVGANPFDGVDSPFPRHSGHRGNVRSHVETPSWQVDDAELPKEAEVVEATPSFDDLSVCDAEDVDPRQGDGVTCSALRPGLRRWVPGSGEQLDDDVSLADQEVQIAVPVGGNAARNIAPALRIPSRSAVAPNGGSLFTKSSAR